MTGREFMAAPFASSKRADAPIFAEQGAPRGGASAEESAR
jgi:hypothetical protein